MVRKKNISAKEKYERQKQLARDRQRRRKERMTEEEKEAKRKYDRERIAKLREEKKVKRIDDMTEREQRKMRKYWRERHRVQKQKKLALENVASITPPDSPLNFNNETIQKKRGRKQVRKDKAKAYRTIHKQKERIKDLEKKLEKYKKRLHREKKKMKESSSPSPRKQLKEILGKEKVSPNVKKQLFLGLALKKQVECQAKEASAKKKKIQVLRRVIGNKVFKKYRVQKYFKKLVPYKINKTLEPNGSFDYHRAPKKSISYKLSNVLISFFEEDTVSRMCPGKKDMVKKGQVKKQRRVLLDTMDNLFKRFKTEANLAISRTTFYRSRPFWVTFPKMSDRDTCACIRHSNIDLLVSALKSLNIIKERTAKDLIKSTVCSIENENCMMGRCETCTGKSVELSFEGDFTFKFQKWVTLKEEKTIKGKKRIIKKTVKSIQKKRVSKLKSFIYQEIASFKKHVFYAKHQISVLKGLTDNLKPGSLVFRIDFSENYVAKFSEEVQSVHFGASKRQLSLNTGVRYACVKGNTKSLSFATASDNLDHQAHAIWAHLKPVLEQSANEFPDTDTVHIFSDSPSSQYRNRINVYLMKNMMPDYFPKLTTVTWNWTEAGHGKGPMDGVGGVLKRGADQKVLHGTDITCAKEFLSALKDYDILMFEIPSSDIECLKSVVAQLKIPPIKGIMQVHQITWCKGANPMQCRTLSCFGCLPTKRCQHYHFSEINLNSEIPGTSTSSEAEKSIQKVKLSVKDVYTSSDDDDYNEEIIDEIILPSPQNDLTSTFAGNVCGPVLTNELVSGVYVIVEYEVIKGKKREKKTVYRSLPKQCNKQ